MANKINIKLILELHSRGLSRNRIALEKHIGKHSRIHADSIMDRIVHNAIWLYTGTKNMRELTSKGYIG